MRRAVFQPKEGEEVIVRQIKTAGGIIRHSVQWTRVIKDRRSEQRPTVHLSPDAKKIRHNPVNGRSLPEAPADCGGVVLPVEGACQAWREQTRGRQDSCNNRPASSKSEFVIPPVGFYQVSRSATMSSGHCKRQTKFFPLPSGSIHTPPAPMPEALQNPRAVGRRRTTSPKKRGWESELVLSLCQCAISG